MQLFGVIGYPLGHSLSAEFFTEKFRKENLDEFEYRLFPLKKLDEIQALIRANPALSGLNVTIPYKTEVIKYLDYLDPVALQTNAVNCIRLSHKSGKPFLEGFNTDVYGFEKSLKPHLKSHHKKALILGTGGSSKAVAFVLNKLNIEFLFVSRNPIGTEQIDYSDTRNFISKDHLIINTTPLGMCPETSNCPAISYDFLTDKHLLFDLVYNPEMTTFLRKGKLMGATVLNGKEMFRLQALKSWDIWQVDQANY